MSLKGQSHSNVINGSKPYKCLDVAKGKVKNPNFLRTSFMNDPVGFEIQQKNEKINAEKDRKVFHQNQMSPSYPEPLKNHIFLQAIFLPIK